jgi:[ribosomal protein S5]-alanine N-acetyltransferase
VIVVHTLRLVLRELERADAPFMLALLNDPDFLANIGDRGVRSPEAAADYITAGPVASYAKHGFGLYAVLRADGAAPIGICGLLRRDSHPDVEIGFALLPGGRGQGYALEAAQATVRLARERFGLRRIVAITAPGNDASISILNSLGMHFERMARFAASGAESRLFVLDDGVTQA